MVGWHSAANVDSGILLLLACSFWLADADVLVGRRDDAQILFERLLSLRNDLGLLSEQYDPVAKRLLGNFPQAFSHIAIVNTAHNIEQAQKPCEQHSGHQSLTDTADFHGSDAT
jgi:GH15 family glucan-1,4-alpha-glucosidase